MKKTMLAILALTTLGAASGVEAQRERRAPRGADVVVVRDVRPIHPSQRRHTYVRSTTSRRQYAHRASWELEEQRRDLRQIRDITRAWHRANARFDFYELSLADQRLSVWLERELRQAHYRGADPYFRDRLDDLSLQLEVLDRRQGRRGSRRHDSRRKARILDELVQLSESEVARARARVPRDLHWSVARR